jgi:hypothetical protein
MKSLKSIEIKRVYRSGKDNLLSDFYLPVLQTAKYYDRAVGYFSTSLIAYALKGISAIVKNDGKIRLVVGHPLEEDEFEALKEGKALDVISDILSDELTKIMDGCVTRLEKERLKLFMLLVATNRIEMKFAFKVKGMYHEKIGIVIDDFGDKILFHGSANETKNAIYPDLNFESIAVYRSWESGIYKDYALDFEKGFEDLWLGLDDSVYTIDMPSEIYQKISDQYRKNGDNLKEPFVNELDLESLIRKCANSKYPLINI